jgi:hypothetical protein
VRYDTPTGLMQQLSISIETASSIGSGNQKVITSSLVTIEIRQLYQIPSISGFEMTTLLLGLTLFITVVRYLVKKEIKN